MIVIGLIRENQKIQGFRVLGHAGYRPRGEDIICAAVSMLAQTALLGLHDYAGIKITYAIDEDKGTLRCCLPSSGMTEKQLIMADTVMETMVLGVKNLQRNYPDHIRIFRRRWTSCC